MKATLKTVYDHFNVLLSPIGKVVIAGGCIRDTLLGNEPKDFDVFVLCPGERAEGEPFTVPKEQFEKSLRSVSIATCSSLGSGPYLVRNCDFRGSLVQVMASPHGTIDDLLDSFDWNICLFAWDGSTFTLRESIRNIGPGMPLIMNRVTYPLSTLRRGFRFSERFGMYFSRGDVERLCSMILMDSTVVESAK